MSGVPGGSSLPQIPKIFCQLLLNGGMFWGATPPPTQVGFLFLSGGVSGVSGGSYPQIDGIASHLSLNGGVSEVPGKGSQPPDPEDSQRVVAEWQGVFFLGGDGGRRHPGSPE